MSYQLEEQELNNPTKDFQTQPEPHSLQQTLAEAEQVTDGLPTGVSIESASYMENNDLTEDESDPSFVNISESEEEEHTPKLFSEEQSYQSEEITSDSNNLESNDTGQLFDEDVNEDEDFEIPAFLRKQKF